MFERALTKENKIWHSCLGSSQIYCLNKRQLPIRDPQCVCFLENCFTSFNLSLSINYFSYSAHPAISSVFAIFHPKSFRRATCRIDELPLLGGKDLVDYRRMLLKTIRVTLLRLTLPLKEKRTGINRWRNGIFKGVALHAAMGVMFHRL